MTLRRAPSTARPWPRALAAADVVVVPSVRDRAGNVDGLPNVLLEALAAGPRRGGHARGRHPRRRPATTSNGLLVPERDPAALAAALRRLRREPETRARLGARARRRTAETTLTWDAAVARLRRGLCRSGSAGRPLRAPATASTSRASARSCGALDLPARAAFALGRGLGLLRAPQPRAARRASARSWSCASTASATC